MAANVKTQDFARRLIAWHRRHGRHDLPWQSRPADPYKVWLSEIMLQQTQVATVIPYFERFIARFPSLHALALAHEQEVLALWSGLGYYHRARNLLACARRLIAEHGGQFPSSAEQLAQLPGIGPSTAAAIAATVFNERVAILDGNVKRVLSRIERAQAPWASPGLERLLWMKARERLPQAPDEMPEYTQAIMDLGAIICRPRRPQCDQCPVIADCTAAKDGVVDQYPQPREKRKLPTRQAYWALCSSQEHVWLTQQPSSGIWPGLWLPWPIDPSALPQSWMRTAAHIRETLEIRHSFTHYRLQISIAILVWQGTKPPLGAPKNLQRFLWKEALALPLPSPVARLLSRLCPAGPKTDGAPSRRIGI